MSKYPPSLGPTIVAGSLGVVSLAAAWAFQSLDRDLVRSLDEAPQPPKATQHPWTRRVLSVEPFAAEIWPIASSGEPTIEPPAAAQDEGHPAMELQLLGFVLDPGLGPRCAAVYDGLSDRIVLARVGDSVGGARVERFEASGVVLMDHDRTTRLELCGAPR